MIIDCTISDLKAGDIASLSPLTYRSCELRITKVVTGLPRGGVRIHWIAGDRARSGVFPGKNPALRMSR